jgi:hypothetical protein
MSKNPNERQGMSGHSEDLDRDIQEPKHEKRSKGSQEAGREQQPHGQTEPVAQNTGPTGVEKRKQTVRFDKGQKFTSDEDIIRRSA